MHGDTAALASLGPKLDVNTKGRHGMTLMELALTQVLDSTASLNVVRALLARGADPNAGLENAIKASDGLMLATLLDAGAKPNFADDRGPVVFQWLGVTPIANFTTLLDHGLDVNLLDQFRRAADRPGRSGRSLGLRPAPDVARRRPTSQRPRRRLTRRRRSKPHGVDDGPSGGNESRHRARERATQRTSRRRHDDVPEPSGAEKDPAPTVDITTSGRGGGFTYREGANSVAFDMEFGMAPELALAWGPTRAEWDARYPWAIGRQAEIYAFVGAEVVRQKAPGGAAEYDLDLGHLTILNETGARARGLYVSNAAAAAKALKEYGSADARLAAAEEALRDDPPAFETVLAREIRRLYRPEDGLERVLRACGVAPD